MVATLFALRIGSVDTTPFQETEKRIRRKVGTPIKTAKAKELNLPVPTEWVLTNQEHIDKIKAAINKMKDEKLKKGKVDITAVPDLIDVFLSECSLPPPPLPPTEFQDWIKKEAGKNEPKKEN